VHSGTFASSNYRRQRARLTVGAAKSIDALRRREFPTRYLSGTRILRKLRLPKSGRGHRVHVALQDKLAVYGQRTYVGAWALEIVAAILGLTTGIALGFKAFSTATPGSITSMDLVLASRRGSGGAGVIRIAVTQAAYEAIAATPRPARRRCSLRPRGSVTCWSVFLKKAG
jgi:hypothetical protein